MEGARHTDEDSPELGSNPGPSVYVLIPALDEERGIGRVIECVPRDRLRDLGYTPRTIVIDGGSRDRTRSIASDLGAEVLLQRGRGKGQAIRHIREILVEEGLAAPPETNGHSRYVVLDADGTYPPDRIVDLVRRVDQGFDLVLGSRFQGTIEPGAMTILNWIGNRLLTRLFRLLYGVPVTDICTGMYGFNEEVLRTLELTADGFDIEAEIFASVCLAAAAVTELPIRYSRRIGPPKMVPLRSGARIGWRILTGRLHRVEPVYPRRLWRRRARIPVRSKVAAEYLTLRSLDD